MMVSHVITRQLMQQGKQYDSKVLKVKVQLWLLAPCAGIAEVAKRQLSL